MASKKILAGTLEIGGGAAVSVQSMTNTKTADVESTVRQIERLQGAGCDIVRVAVPDAASARAIYDIKKRIGIPLVADIHYDHSLAILAVEAGADKVRINPGNIGGDDRVRAVANICGRKNVPIRVGVNGGSLDREILKKHGGVTPRALAESAMEHVRLLNRFDFDDICVSVKASSVPVTIAAYRILSEMTSCPLHLGVTGAGTEYMGVIKSAAGIGTLLSEGIGDTIRVSLTAEPVREVVAGASLLKALGLRRGGVELICCPTCSRCGVDLIHIALEVERRLAGCEREITVAVMGCAVNGPGEAKRADFGVAGGDGEGVLFKRGEIVGKAPAAALVDELINMIEGN